MNYKLMESLHNFSLFFSDISINTVKLAFSLNIARENFQGKQSVPTLVPICGNYLLKETTNYVKNRKMK